MFKWDGSFLGEYGKNVLYYTDASIIKNIKVGAIFIDGIHHPCYIRKRIKDQKLNCIIDEMKVIFGVKKTGTHTISVAGTIYLLYKINEKNGVVRIDKIFETKCRSQNIMRLLILRTVCNIKVNKKSIYMRDGYPISFDDDRIEKSSMNCISPGLLNLHFNDVRISDYCKTVFNIKSKKDLSRILHSIKEFLLKLFNRIDSERLWQMNIILDNTLELISF